MQSGLWESVLDKVEYDKKLASFLATFYPARKVN